MAPIPSFKFAAGDEKLPYDERGAEIPPPSARKPARKTNPFVAGISMVALLYLIYVLLPGSGWVSALSCHSAPGLLADAGAQGGLGTPGAVKGETQDILKEGGAGAGEVSRTKVPLEAHIMSKCPDARDCLRDLVLPVMQRVVDKVDFRLSYIGTPTDNDGVSCMHGPEECMGNIIELCAAQIYPDPKIYLGFTNCLSKDYPSIPQHSLVEDCALEHAIEIKKLDECAVRDDGAYAMGLLRDSVRRSKDAGVTKSCTVRLDEEIYCIRDNGEWKDCPKGPGVNDLVLAVEKLWQAS